MNLIGFDNDKYLKMQSEHIMERISKFDNKLYLEFGGKLFDDYHASRVLPGFAPDSKIKMLTQLKNDAEIIIVINASDIEKNKVRGDLGITYDTDVLRLIDAFREIGLYVGSVVVSQYAGQAAADHFQKKLESLGIKVYRHYSIAGYPANIPLIVSDEGSDFVDQPWPSASLYDYPPQEQWNAFQKLAQMLMHTPFNAEGIVTKIFTDANGTQHIGLHPIPDRSGLWRYLSTTLLLLTMLGSAIYNGVQAWRRYQRHRTRMMKIQAYYESCLNPQLITPSESLIE